MSRPDLTTAVPAAPTRQPSPQPVSGRLMPRVEWLLLLAALLPFLALSFFNHPTDDDFHGAVMARRFSAWESVQFYYLRWTGRYTSSFLYGWVYGVSDLQAWLLALRLASIGWLLALLGAGRFALRALPYPLSNADRWRISAYGLVLYLHGTPLVSSALYWFSGSAVYTSGIVLLLLLLGLAGNCHRAASDKAKAMWGTLGAGAALLLAGTNELIMVVAVVGLTAWMLWSPRRLWPVVLLLAAVVGAIVTLRAPGNMVRANTVVNTLPVSSRLLLTGTKALYLTGVHLVRWISSGVLLAATGLWLSMLPAPSAPVVRWQWLSLAGVTTGLLLALTLPTVWLTNDVPARIWNALYFVFLLGWFAVCTLARPRRLPAVWRLSVGAARWGRVLLLLVVLLAHGTPVQQAYIDLAFKARQYDAAQQQRYAQLKLARQQGRREPTVAPLFANEYQYPATIFLHELELSPKDIANEGMAHYFGLDSVRLQALPLRTRRHFE